VTDSSVTLRTPGVRPPPLIEPAPSLTSWIFNFPGEETRRWVTGSSGVLALWCLFAYGLAALILIGLVVALGLWSERRMRRDIDRVLEVVEWLEELAGTVLEGEGTALELDRRLSELLEGRAGVPVRLGLGIEVVKVSSLQRWGRWGTVRAVVRAITDVRSRSPRALERVIPFDVRLRAGSDEFHLRGAVIPLPLRSLTAFLGVGRREGEAGGPDLAFGGAIRSKRVFSALSVLLTLGPRRLRKLVRRGREGKSHPARPDGRGRPPLDPSEIADLLDAVCGDHRSLDHADDAIDDVLDAVEDAVSDVLDSIADAIGDLDGGDGGDGDGGRRVGRWRRWRWWGWRLVSTPTV